MRMTAKKRRPTGSESNQKCTTDVESKRNPGSRGSKDEAPGNGANADTTLDSSRLISKGNETVQPDDHKKLAELFSTEYISAMKMKENEVLDMSKTLIITDSWRNEWNRGVQVPVESVLPAAIFRDCPNEPATKNFKLPQKLIRSSQDDKFHPEVHERVSVKSEDESCRYDLDDLDTRWRTLYNCQAAELGLEQLDEETCEKAIEHFESVCYDKLSERKMNDSILGIEFDEDSVCDVCQAPESEDENEMVFCDSCNVAVHQMCYGIPQVPAGTWFCRACAAGVKPSCILCPNTGGAFKSTRSGTRWCHVSCALWIPEVGFHDPEYMEPVTNIAGIPESRWLLRCSLCRERRKGACVQCEFKGCSTAFHVTCAQRQKLTFQLLPSVDAAGNETVVMKQYCMKHSEHSSQKPETPDEGGVMSRETVENQRAKRLEEIEDEFFTCVDPAVSAETLQMHPFIISTLYEYWKLKRKSSFNKPLMRAKKEEDQIMERQQEDILNRKIRMLIYLRQNLETARNLCYMVVKREKTKKQWYQSVESIFKVQSSLIENSSQHLTGRELTTLLKTFDSGDSAYDRLMHVGRGETSNSRALSDSEEKSQVPSTTDELITPHASRKRDDSELSDSDKRNKSTKKEEKEDEETTAGRSPVSPKPQLISIGKEKSTKVDLPKKEAQKKGVEGKKKSPSPVISPRRASLRQKLGGVEETREKTKKNVESEIIKESVSSQEMETSSTGTADSSGKRRRGRPPKRKSEESRGESSLESPPLKRALRSVPSRRSE